MTLPAQALSKGLFTICLVGIGLYLFWTLQNRSPILQPARGRPSPESYGLRIDPSAQSFGEVWESDDFQWTIPISNHGKEPVHIESFSTDCTCAKIEPSGLRLEKGETRSITLHIDLTVKTTPSTPDVRQVALSIAPVVKLASSKLVRCDSWELNGISRRSLLPESRYLDLGRISRLARPLPSTELKVTSLVEVKSFRIHTTSSLFSATVRQGSASNKYRLAIKAISPLPTKQHECEIRITPTTQGGEELPSTSVVLRANVVEDVEALRAWSSGFASLALRLWSPLT